MMTFCQGLPGQQPVPGTLDFPRNPQKLPSTSEAESEASMSEASSEDPVPSLEAEVAPDRDKEEAGKKKKKKTKGLANMFSVFTKGRKKKPQPSSAEPQAALHPEPESGPRLGGRLPTVEELKADLECGRLEAARPLLALERELQAAAAAAARRDVAQTAEERLGRPPAEGAEGRSEAERIFLHMGRTMKEDLEAVVERLKPLFPAEFGVVAAYAESYHQSFAAQLEAMAQFELCQRDTYMLLVWVQNFYPNEIINSPKLARDLQGVGLGSLLPSRQIRLLEATFLSNEVASVKEMMARALDLESKRWAQDVAPQRLDGHCHSELAIDIIQIISQGQAKAEEITLDLGMQIKHMLLVELVVFLRSYQRAFDEFLERCRLLRNYRANVIANINNCLSFRTSMEQKWQTSQDLPSHLLGPLSELKSHGFDNLLQKLFEDLKPLFKRFTQTRWAAARQTLEEIIATVGERLPEFLELHDCFREELMEAVHLHLVKEYIIRLSKRRVVLKTAEQQEELAGHIQANAKLIQQFCMQNGSPATWLHHALPTLAEIIRLQDPSAIKLEVATYATSYPDFSKGHLGAILAIKGNLSSSEFKSIRSILDIDTGAREPFKSLFSLIKVG
ncbi:PREDICTED: tumor necrosis factor alpha-induced protein 2 [Ceratotherium simum simum]|uniref:Tumor necrosis factor alpha-induced protein 2 n=1 Tax=Ceratotherium simum simum TaxID=73337 RepID=A0ABM1D2A9_CERSS|nr:PREDICTED: tumor necrosis factor alpha-induced protein 2 [Ceratotherium simum simum]